MKQKISESEWEIMKIIWKLGKGNLAQILDKLDKKNWSNSTVQTYLQRLIKKGYVQTERKGHAYIYSANISEEECKLEESRNFIDRVFEGSLSNMVLQFTNKEKISDKEKQILYKILEKWDENGHL